MLTFRHEHSHKENLDRNSVIFLLGAVSCSTVHSSKTSPTFAGAVKGPSTETLARLKKCVQECSSEDAALSRNLIDALVPVVEKEKKYADQLPLITSVFNKALDQGKKENDPEKLARLYSVARPHLGTLEAQEIEDPAFAKRVDQIIRQFPVKHPDSAKAWGTLGHYLSTKRASPLETIGAFKHCIQLNGDDWFCRKSYDAVAEKYTQPYCLGADVARSFGIYLEGHRKVPRLASSDIDSVTYGKDDFGQETFSVLLKEGGKTIFDELTRKNRGKKMFFMLHDKVLMAPVIMEEIISGNILISTGPDSKNSADKESICKKTTAQKIPKELRI